MVGKRRFMIGSIPRDSITLKFRNGNFTVGILSVSYLFLRDLNLNCLHIIPHQCGLLYTHYVLQITCSSYHHATLVSW